MTLDALHLGVGRHPVGLRLRFHRGVAGVGAERLRVGRLVALEPGEDHEPDEGDAEPGEQPQAPPEARVGELEAEVESDLLAPAPGVGDLQADGDQEDHRTDEDDRGHADERDERPVGVLGVGGEVEGDEDDEYQRPRQDHGPADGGEGMPVEALR